MAIAAENTLNFWESYWNGPYAIPRVWAHLVEYLAHEFEAILAVCVTKSIDFNLSDQALMLAGMAIEVQLKGNLVHPPSVRGIVTRQVPAKVERHRQLLRTLYTHKLVELFSAAGIRRLPNASTGGASMSFPLSARSAIVHPLGRHSSSNFDHCRRHMPSNYMFKPTAEIFSC